MPSSSARSAVVLLVLALVALFVGVGVAFGEEVSPSPSSAEVNTSANGDLHSVSSSSSSVSSSVSSSAPSISDDDGEAGFGGGSLSSSSSSNDEDGGGSLSDSEGDLSSSSSSNDEECGGSLSDSEGDLSSSSSSDDEEEVSSSPSADEDVNNQVNDDDGDQVGSGADGGGSSSAGPGEVSSEGSGPSVLDGDTTINSISSASEELGSLRVYVYRDWEGADNCPAIRGSIDILGPGAPKSESIYLSSWSKWELFKNLEPGEWSVVFRVTDIADGWVLAGGGEITASVVAGEECSVGLFLRFKSSPDVSPVVPSPPSEVSGEYSIDIPLECSSADVPSLFAPDTLTVTVTLSSRDEDASVSQSVVLNKGVRGSSKDYVEYEGIVHFDNLPEGMWEVVGVSGSGGGFVVDWDGHSSHVDVGGSHPFVMPISFDLVPRFSAYGWYASPVRLVLLDNGKIPSGLYATVVYTSSAGVVYGGSWYVNSDGYIYANDNIVLTPGKWSLSLDFDGSLLPEGYSFLHGENAKVDIVAGQLNTGTGTPVFYYALPSYSGPIGPDKEDEDEEDGGGSSAGSDKEDDEDGGGSSSGADPVPPSPSSPSSPGGSGGGSSFVVPPVVPSVVPSSPSSVPFVKPVAPSIDPLPSIDFEEPEVPLVSTPVVEPIGDIVSNIFPPVVSGSSSGLGGGSSSVVPPSDDDISTARQLLRVSSNTAPPVLRGVADDVVSTGLVTIEDLDSPLASPSMLTQTGDLSGFWFWLCVAVLAVVSLVLIRRRWV